MALIEQFEFEHIDTEVQKPVERATYSTFTNEHGARFLYIRTFGSASRQNPGQPSQHFQLGPEAIAQLKEILAGV